MVGRGVRRRICRVGRGRLQHRDDRLSGDRVRRVVQRAGRRPDVPADRQLRHLRTRRGVTPAVGRGARRARAELDVPGGHGRPRRVPPPVRRPRDLRCGHARARAAPPRERHACAARCCRWRRVSRTIAGVEQEAVAKARASAPLGSATTGRRGERRRPAGRQRPEDRAARHGGQGEPGPLPRRAWRDGACVPGDRQRSRGAVVVAGGHRDQQRSGRSRGDPADRAQREAPPRRGVAARHRRGRCRSSASASATS